MSSIHAGRDPFPSRSANSERTPTVFLVEDETEVRETLQAALNQAGFAAQAFASAEAFVAAVPSFRSGCLILDLDLPGMSGLELQQLLADLGRSLPTVVITGSSHVRSVVEAMRAGAIDILEKPFELDAMLELVHEALQQDCSLRCLAAERSASEQRLERLSPREREVMIRLASNKSTKQIAAELGISPKTVDVHRSRIMAKTNADGVVELVHLAHKLGMVKYDNQRVHDIQREQRQTIHGKLKVSK